MTSVAISSIERRASCGSTQSMAAVEQRPEVADLLAEGDQLVRDLVGRAGDTSCRRSSRVVTTESGSEGRA